MFGYGYSNNGPWFTEDSLGQPFTTGAAALEVGKGKIFDSQLDAKERIELRIFVAELTQLSLGGMAADMASGILADLKERVATTITDDGADEVITAIDAALIEVDPETNVRSEGVGSVDFVVNFAGFLDWWAKEYDIPAGNKAIRVMEFKEDDPWRG